jgi:hypothetical protein
MNLNFSYSGITTCSLPEEEGGGEDTGDRKSIAQLHLVLELEIRGLCLIPSNVFMYLFIIKCRNKSTFYLYITFKVRRSENVKIIVFCLQKPCSLIAIYQGLAGICCVFKTENYIT